VTRPVGGALIDVVLFDLGGVLIELGGVAAMRELTGIESDDELWRRWLGCPWVRSYERGECSTDEFAKGVADDWGLTIEPAAFLAAFAAWPLGPLPGAEALVATVRRSVPVGCLSNTNAMHCDAHFSRWPIFDAFDFRFLSYELGLLKPDREVFDRVAQLVAVPPERILFLDDNQLNVDGARDAGFTAARARGVAEAEDALTAAGVLRA
jgi:HAD superfamily hydrolase (TIGR01509 family)